MTSFFLLMLGCRVIIGLFLIFRKSVICKKYTNTNGKDCKYTNTIYISVIWLYWTLYCTLYWTLFCMFCRLYSRLFFAAQYFFFSFFHKCSKLMTLSDTSRMFLSCYYFLLFLRHFYLTQNPRGYHWFSNSNPRGNSFRIYRHVHFDFLKKSLPTTNSSSVNTSFSSCIILRFILAIGYQTKIALTCSLNFLVYPFRTASRAIGIDFDAYLR